MNEPQNGRARTTVARIVAVGAVLSAGIAIAIMMIGSDGATNGPTGWDQDGLDPQRRRIAAVNHDLCSTVPTTVRNELGIADLTSSTEDTGVTIDCLIGSEVAGPYLLARVYSDATAIDPGEVRGRSRTAHGLRTVEIDRLRSTERSDHEDGATVVFWKGPYSGFVEYIGPADDDVEFQALRSVVDRLARDALPSN